MNTVLINGTPLNVGAKKTQPKKSKALSKLKRQMINIAEFLTFTLSVFLFIEVLKIAALYIGELI